LIAENIGRGSDDVLEVTGIKRIACVTPYVVVESELIYGSQYASAPDKEDFIATCDEGPVGLDFGRRTVLG